MHYSTGNVLSAFDTESLWVHRKIPKFITTDKIVCLQTRIQTLLCPNASNRVSGIKYQYLCCWADLCVRLRHSKSMPTYIKLSMLFRLVCLSLPAPTITRSNGVVASPINSMSTTIVLCSEVTEILTNCLGAFPSGLLVDRSGDILGRAGEVLVR